MDIVTPFSLQRSMLPQFGNQRPTEHRFSPYEDNHGSVAAIAGEDFAIIASDTRLSQGFTIYSRHQSKLFKLSDKTVVGISGCWCDTLTFIKILTTKFKMYQHEFNKEMSTTAVSQLITSLLYYKRFFPYYVHCIVAGIDQDGKGRCYGYDSVGHKGEDSYKATGSAFCLMAPLLDNQVGMKNMAGVEKEPLTLEKAKTVLKDIFISAAERDIYTGDSVVLNIITKDGIKSETYELRKD